MLDAAYWDNRYKDFQTQWDIGAISTPLKNYFDQVKNKNLAILIPGCGNSYEASYLLENGFTNITLVDLSILLTEKLRQQFNKHINSQIKIISGDFFDLDGKWDLIVEQTFFCALDPELRKKYVVKMHELLNPGGKIVGVLFDREFEGGPPFGGSKEEYLALFKTNFRLKTMETCYNSIQPRMGSELFFIAVKDDLQ